MKRPLNRRLFLYRYRLHIGYTLLGLVFVSLLFLLPTFSPGGISQAEMESVVASEAMTLSPDNIVHAPFHLLQKASIAVFGLSLYSIKLPSILLGLVTGIFLVLLLNRWFKNNIAILASAITILSSLFLFLAGSGTPVITYIFWTTLILWLCSKIIGERSPSPWLIISLIVVFALSAYTPLMAYVTLILGFIALLQPHLRFYLKRLKKWQFALVLVFFTITISHLIICCFMNFENFRSLFLLPDNTNFFDNMSSAFIPFFSFTRANEGIYLSPFFGIATIIISLIGLIAIGRHLYTARNLVLTVFIVFSIVGSGVNPSAATLIFIPLSILTATGLKQILDKWYKLFPENPYARIFGLLPIVAFSGIIIFSGISHFSYGYHYSPGVARSFNNDLTLIAKNVPAGSVLLVPDNTIEYAFYSIYSHQAAITVSSSLYDRASTIVTLGKWDNLEIELPLKEIIVSHKTNNSDRLYLYQE